MSDVARDHERDQARDRNRQNGAERRRMQRLDQRLVHDLGIPGPVDRPHAHEQIDGLLRGVIEEFGDDLDRPQRPDDGNEHRDVERGAHHPLGEGEALPAAQRGARGSGGEGSAHWNSLRIQPETISPIMTTAMMASTMVSTKS